MVTGEALVEWLRRFVETKQWDYCVVWKLGDDPLRFIEWVGCCCSGACENPCLNHVKIEEEEESLFTGPINSNSCRDANHRHLVRTKACEALAHFPSRLPLYSGIRGEVVMSNQTKWLIPSHDSTTQVLIPVFGGLIEIFAAKHILKDQLMIDSVKAHCNAVSEEAMIPHISTDTSGYSPKPKHQETMNFVAPHSNFSLEQQLTNTHGFCNVSLNEHKIDHPLLGNSLVNFQPSLPFFHLMQVSQLNALRSFQGSSSSSNIFNENPPFDSHFGYTSPNEQWEQSPVTKYSTQFGNMSKQLPGSGKVKKDQAKAIRKPSKNQCHSKNLITERNRRSRIKDGLYALRALVPNITKMDKIAILGDAIDHIGYLKNECERLNAELADLENEDCKSDVVKLNYRKSDRAEVSNGLKERNTSSLNADEKVKTELQVEVNQIGKRDFFIKILCKKKCGGFAKLMERLNLMELQVLDINVTALNGLVLNILRVEANADIKLKKLRDSLLELGL